MRGMGLVPVNPQKVTSMVGHSPDIDDELRVTHLSNRNAKTLGDQPVNCHRGNRGIETAAASNRRLNGTGGNRREEDKTPDVMRST